MFWNIDEIAQTGFVVDDLDRAIDRWHGKGCGKFTVFKDLEVPLVSYGNEVTFKLSIALGQFNGVQIELIHPLYAQNSVFTDRFPDGWPSGDDGFHHLGLVSNNFDNSSSKLISDGYAAMQNQDDQVRLQLISGLLLEAGRLMEHVSPEFAMRLPADIAGVTARIDLLETTASDLRALAAGARALLRGMGPATPGL